MYKVPLLLGQKINGKNIRRYRPGMKFFCVKGFIRYKEKYVPF
jgi:hypothetical protein